MRTKAQRRTAQLRLRAPVILIAAMLRALAFHLGGVKNRRLLLRYDRWGAS